MDGIHDRTTIAAGVVGPATVLVTLAFGALSSPAFDWPGDPFSVIGATGGPTATLFDAGLVLGGLASVPFARPLWRTAGSLAGGTYAVVGLSLAGAGLLPAAEGTVLHEVFGSLAFLGIPVLLWVAGVTDWRAGDRRAGVGALVPGSVALLVWLPYDLGLERAQIGYGAAELVALLAFALWSGWTTVRLWNSTRRTSGGPTGATS